MKRIMKPSYQGQVLACRIMAITAVVLIVLIVCGTLYGMFRPADSDPLFRIGSAAGNIPVRRSPGQGNTAGAAVNVFTGIGRLRIPVAGRSGQNAASRGATLILSIAFPYSPEDRPFTEELASRIAEFKTIAADYFSALPAAGIITLDEEAAKIEILRRYNTVLRLGKIEALYFNDLMVIE